MPDSAILQQAPASPRQRADELLPLVYDELRKLAEQRLAREQPGLTLDATSLVHEAYLRLTGQQTSLWDNRAHFFAAAAESMRRILVEAARRRHSLKRGGNRERQDFLDCDILLERQPLEILEVHEALDLLALADARAAELVKLRYFVGLNFEEIAQVLDLSPRRVADIWSFAKAWLQVELARNSRSA